MNVTPYERTRWDKGQMEALDRLNKAQRTADDAYAAREAHPKNAEHRRHFRRCLQNVRYAHAIYEEWTR